MFKLLRRISSSVFPRNDRPWDDDATSTAPTVGMKRRLSSVDMDLDAPVGSLSKKSRRDQDADASDGEEPASSPVASSPPPPRLSPPEGVKEVTTGVKEIELDQKPDAPPLEPSAAVELPATPVRETPVGASEEVETDTEEDPISEQRSEDGDTPEVEGSQDTARSDTADEIPVTPVQEPKDDSKDTTKTSEGGVKPLVADLSSPIRAPRSKSAAVEPVDLEDNPEVDA